MSEPNKREINKPIQTAIEVVGGQLKLAIKIGVAQPTVWNWLHEKKRVSPQYVPAIVKATKGKVLASDLRPDLPHLFPPPKNRNKS